MLLKKTGTVITLVVFFLAAQTFAAGDLEQRRNKRHQARSISVTPMVRPLEARESFSQPSALGADDVLDAKVFADQYEANFTQRYPDLAHFSNGTGLAVWEDQRNGDWDILAQVFNIDGAPSGINFEMLSDPTYQSQRQPKIAIDGSDHVALVWTEEGDAGVYAAVFNSNLIQLGPPIRLDDAAGANAANLPAVAGLSDGGFVVVWEDIRSGANIYAQMLQLDGSLDGTNFRVNDSSPSATRLAPAVTAGAAGSFAVVWEDARDGETDVYFKSFTSTGTAQTADLKVADGGFEDSFQFNGQVGYVSDGYFVACWISDRNDEQGVYAQLVAPSGTFSGTNYQLNSASTDVCWDLSAKNTAAGGTAVCWANLSEMATIEYVFLGSDGSLGLSGEAQDEDLAGERGAPALCWSADGGQAVWMDERFDNQDIFAQQFESEQAPLDSNVIINDDLLGSQQLCPAVAPLPDGKVAVVWQDQREDGGDIYLQLTNLTGTPAMGAELISDDRFDATQQAPQAAAGSNSGIMVVWEDNREYEKATNKKVMGQFLSLTGNKIGSNVLVSDDPAGVAQSSPAVAVSGGGYALVIWTEESTPAKSILLQAFNPGGSKFGGNEMLTAPPGASDNLAPKCGLRDDASGVATWTSVVGGKRRQYFQRLTELIYPEGDLEMVELDPSLSQVLDADIFVHATNGEFYIAVVDSQLAGTEIKLFRYDEASALQAGATTVASGLGGGVEDLRVVGDVDDALLVTWTQLDGGIRQAYGRLVHQFGNTLGDAFKLSDGGALESDPATAMLTGQYFAVWCDNRSGGRGFDLYANSVLYTSAAAADEENVLPLAFALEQNYPNPFNPSTTIGFKLDRPGRVKLEVLNLLGQRVALLLDGYRQAGSHQLLWDSESAGAGAVSSGVYFYRLTTETGSLTRKMTLLK